MKSTVSKIDLPKRILYFQNMIYVKGIIHQAFKICNFKRGVKETGVMELYVYINIAVKA